jgi:hypothetical protein
MTPKIAIRNRHLSRRAVLKGLGTAIALPALDAMIPAVASAATPAKALAPLRMAVIYVPNGVNVDEWMPKRTGYMFELPYVLEPLKALRQDILVISGLTHDKGRANGDGPGDHARAASAFLTGCQPVKTDGANIRVGISADQLAARHVGRETVFPSLELGCEPSANAGSCDSGYSCAYSSNISWRDPYTPATKEVNPALVFDRLFGRGRQDEVHEQRAQRELLRRSILDFVLEEARRLKRQLGPGDQRKLDEYLTSIREVERRIEVAKKERREPGDEPFEYERPAGIPREYAEHIRLMTDLLALAFQTNLARVATLVFANEGSNRSYRFIQVPEGHHDLSHHGGNEEKLRKISQINRFHVSMLARFLHRLKAIPEGDGTLLDHCMILYGSGISDGNRHNDEDLPILLAGRANGTIRTGRHIRVQWETPMCNLLVSMLKRMGVEVDRFGDSTGELTDLS